MTTTGPRRARLRVLIGALSLAVLTSALAGCGTASAPSPPAGVDGLVIPTPSPDPSDFVATVDNPWLPLEPGTAWTYQVADAHGEHLLRVTVLAAHRVVAGVDTTVVESREQGRTVTDYYAQDTAGNVWWFGRKGSWLAGTDGAEAGIAMLATPRVGDGYRDGFLHGVMEDFSTIMTLEGAADVPTGEYDHVLEVEGRSQLRPGVVHLLSYAEGVGLVEERSIAGDYLAERLVRFTHP